MTVLLLRRYSKFVKRTPATLKWPTAGVARIVGACACFSEIMLLFAHCG